MHVGPEFADAIDEEFTSGQREAAESPQRVHLHAQKSGRTGHGMCNLPDPSADLPEFRCYHMIIFDSRGEIAGRMVGRADIQTTDPVLARIWNDEVRLLPCPATPRERSRVGGAGPGGFLWCAGTEGNRLGKF